MCLYILTAVPISAAPPVAGGRYESQQTQQILRRERRIVQLFSKHDQQFQTKSNYLAVSQNVRVLFKKVFKSEPGMMSNSFYMIIKIMT